MSRFKYTETEQLRNNVLVYHDRELKAIQEKRDSVDARGTIDASTELLKSLGYGDRVSEIEPTGTKIKQEVVLLRDWQDIVTEAEQQVGNNCKLEDLFTGEELRENSEAIRLLNREFNDLHKLDKFDVSIAALAANVGAIIDIVLSEYLQKVQMDLKQDHCRILSARNLTMYFRQLKWRSLQIQRRVRFPLMRRIIGIQQSMLKVCQHIITGYCLLDMIHY